MSQDQNFDEETKLILDNQVNPVLEKMVVDILTEKPENLVNYMITWLEDKGKKILERKKRELEKEKENDSESSDDEEEEMPKDLQDRLADAKKQTFRTSVSAEAYGKWNKSEDYKPKIIKKTDAQMNRIKERLSHCFMFSALDDKELQIVINAFEEKKFKKGSSIIKQGEEGDNLYVVDSGNLDCFKKFKKDEQEKFIKLYGPGDAFGELALLYNSPRAATIIAKEDCTLFALDRETFNHIVKNATKKKRETYEKFLESVEILASMDPYERTNLADALKPVKYQKGEFVVKEGETGDVFYIIVEGKAKATKVLKPNEQPTIVYNYKEGDYFGELALLRDQPRAANIIAESDLKLISLDRYSFKRMMGPLEDILKRNFTRYEKFASK